MITKKLWNSFTESTRSEVLTLLRYNATALYSQLVKPYNHDFSFNNIGKELKKILECCYFDSVSGKLKVCSVISVSYAPKEVKKTVIHKPVEEPKKNRYICYYEERSEDGELLDDFKEWCDAYSEDEAREYFKDNYSHNPRVEISMIVQERS